MLQVDQRMLTELQDIPPPVGPLPWLEASSSSSSTGMDNNRNSVGDAAVGDAGSSDGVQASSSSYNPMEAAGDSPVQGDNLIPADDADRIIAGGEGYTGDEAAYHTEAAEAKKQQ